MAKSYWERRDAQAEKTYNKTVKEYMDFLKKEYRIALKEIQDEVAKWIARQEEIESINPNFKFSELKMAQDLEKQVSIILSQLADKEINVLADTLMKFYDEDILNFDELLKEYKKEKINGIHDFNNLSSYNTLTALENTGLHTSNQVANFLSHNVWNDKLSWYSPIADGLWFNHRVMIRAEKVAQVISKELKMAVIRGDGYSKVAGSIAKQLDVSFSSAKRLVHNELRIAENQAHIDSAKKNGFTHFRADTIHDDRVCAICQENENKIYRIDQYEPKQLHPHVNCRCVFVPIVVDENNQPIKSQYYNEAQEYVKQRAKENAERTKKIREKYVLDKKK